MLKGMAVALTIATMLVAGCGDSEDSNKNTFSCESAKSKCPNDGALPKEICDAINDVNCSAVFVEFATCFGNNQVCTADGGITDFDATSAKCQAQRDKAEKCAADHPPDGGK